MAAATCNLTSISTGAKTLTGTYTGDANYAASVSAGVAHTVNAATTTTTITGDAPDPSVVGQAYTITVTMSSGGGVPTGTVTVSEGVATCPITLAAGTGSCNLTSTTAGAKTITATYAAQGNFLGSSGTMGHQVNQAATTTVVGVDTPDPSTVGQAYAVPYTVAVTAPGVGTPTGNVTVSDGAVSCTATRSRGDLQPYVHQRRREDAHRHLLRRRELRDQRGHCSAHGQWRHDHHDHYRGPDRSQRDRPAVRHHRHRHFDGRHADRHGDASLTERRRAPSPLRRAPDRAT